MKYYVDIKELTLKEEIKLLLTLKSGLSNHKISSTNDVYRLHHVRCCESLMGVYHEAHSIFEPFKFPDGMTREEGFLVLSYLIDLLEKKGKTGECSLKAINMLEDLIKSENSKFQRVNSNDCSEVIDLYTIEGRTKNFIISEHYPKYFNWYKENVTKEDVKNIYESLEPESKNKQLIKTMQ